VINSGRVARRSR
jgi:transposase